MSNPNALAELALGRILSLGSRPAQPGDVEEYERCRAIIMAATNEPAANAPPVALNVTPRVAELRLAIAANEHALVHFRAKDGAGSIRARQCVQRIAAARAEIEAAEAADMAQTEAFLAELDRREAEDRAAGLWVE